MLITNETNTRQGQYDKMWTALLLGESNTGCSEISIQITHVEPNGAQSLHGHPENQCYYVIQGRGIVTIGDEEQGVHSGDAIFIPSGAIHGIRNEGTVELVYLTANKAFGVSREGEIWGKDVLV